jgi:acetolactate synthase-1/2/3 large subunit
MNGAESLVRTLLAAGVDDCFANPGTSEMHFVAALDQIPGTGCVLGLQENVVTGMADGYFRIAEKPACTLLHCGPGWANGLGNLHNARRARSGIVNIVGGSPGRQRP